MAQGRIRVDDVCMLGQAGHVGTRGISAISVSLACVLISAVGFAALRTDTASADTVLVRGPGATLELADGTRRVAVEGQRVPRGATVLAGAAGAVLQTRDREVHLGGSTGVTVLDGLRQVLRSGFVLVDGSDAPGVQMETPAGIVTTADDSLVRVDGGALVRAGVLRGDAASVRAAGRRATAQVPTYFQVQVPTGGLPGTASPLVLSGDAYERALAADLVRADDDLNSLASRLDANGPAGRVVLTALRTQLAGAPVIAPAAATPGPSAGGDRALGFLVATAAAADDDSLAQRYERVGDLRAAGGSWGVVAAIVSAEVDQVAAALSALLDPEVTPVLASEPFDLGAVLDPASSGAGPDGPAGSGGDGSAPPSGGGGGNDGPDGGSDPQPQPSPSPSPSPEDPTEPVTEVVDEVVDTVLDLISPSPSPSPSSSPTSTSAPLVPLPAISVPPVDLPLPQ